jgi:hypothetical protein
MECEADSIPAENLKTVTKSAGVAQVSRYHSDALQVD